MFKNIWEGLGEVDKGLKQMVTEGNYTLGGERTMQYTWRITELYTWNHVILLTNVANKKTLPEAHKEVSYYQLPSSSQT